MGFSVKHKKKGGTITRTFSYSGDLEKCIEDAKKELKNKEESQERVFLHWQAEKANAALDKYEGRIKDLTDFIRLAIQELVKEREEKGGENSGETENPNL